MKFKSMCLEDASLKDKLNEIDEFIYYYMQTVCFKISCEESTENKYSNLTMAELLSKIYNGLIEIGSCVRVKINGLYKEKYSIERG